MRALRGAIRRTSRAACVAVAVLLSGCDAGAAPAQQATRLPVLRPADAIPDSVFAALHARVSEDGGYFDTDNLISNESGYLNVQGALRRLVPEGGAYVGVGPDQSYSYIATLRPELVFITDVRRDNALHHLLLKVLMERAPTRVGFLAGLHGRVPPSDTDAWRTRTVRDIVDYVDRAPVDEVEVRDLHGEVAEAVVSYGIPLDDEDLATIRRFHQTFIDAGLGLRFTSFGRAPRPYYPTYRQLVLETDAEGAPSSYLVSEEAYSIVRDLHLANRIIPVVGDLAGPHAVREMGAVLNEMGVQLTAFYTSNVEFYLWRGRTFQAWRENLATLPASDDAVIIRSYFPNFGGAHPSALPGYYATQTLQRVETLVEGGFESYWDVVTRGALPLR